MTRKEVILEAAKLVVKEKHFSCTAIYIIANKNGRRSCWDASDYADYYGFSRRRVVFGDRTERNALTRSLALLFYMESL